MGRQLQNKNTGGQHDQEHHNPGCIWGIFHILDYHHQSNSKKALPYKKHLKGGERHAAKCFGISKTISIDHDSGEVQRLLDIEEEHNLAAEQKAVKTSHVTKGKGEKNEKQWSWGFRKEPKLEKSSYVHNVEPLDYSLEKIATGCKDPIVVLRKNAETMSSTKSNVSSPRKRTSKIQKSTDTDIDVLEMFKANKDLFLRILEDPNGAVSKDYLSRQQDFVHMKKQKLKKSGSFPVAESAHGKNLRSSTIDHKRNEFWTSIKREKLVSNMKSIPFSANNKVESAIELEINISSQPTYQKWNHFVIDHLRNIKQRIKHAIKESKKKKRTCENTDGHGHRHMEEMPRNSETINLCQKGEKRSDSIHHIRRAASLNESMDRYSQLFESSFKGGTKLHHSKSLTLKNEEKISTRESAPKFFRRLSSVSDLESFVSLLKEVAKEDLETRVINEVRSDGNIQREDLDDTNSRSIHENSETIESLKDVVDTELRKRVAEESDNIAGISKKPEEVARDCFPNSTMDIAECPISEDSELKLDISADEVNSLSNQQNHSVIDPLPEFRVETNFENDFQFQYQKTDMENSSFNYVRDVLELSDFVGDDCLGNWYALDQPLDPSLLKEMEQAQIAGNHDHQLMFEMINEALLEIYKRSFTYFPKMFSFYAHTRLMPKGHRVVKEVWDRICRYKGCNVDESLDDIVAKDLGKGDGWMSHQFETECLTLKLEDLIFDELLCEIISC